MVQITVTILLADKSGQSCVDGVKAKELLNREVIPSLSDGNHVVFDLKSVKTMSSSFSNALLASIVLQRGPEALKSVSFVNCTANVRFFITAALEFGRQLHERKVNGN